MDSFPCCYGLPATYRGPRARPLFKSEQDCISSGAHTSTGLARCTHLHTSGNVSLNEWGEPTWKSDCRPLLQRPLLSAHAMPGGHLERLRTPLTGTRAGLHSLNEEDA